MRPAPSLITGPTVELLHLDDAKNWLKVDAAITEDDALILMLLKAAREKAEALTWRAFTTQTWEQPLHEFPPVEAWRGWPSTIRLPKPPLQSVTSITYIDEDGATQTWDSANYIVSAPAGPFAPAGTINLAFEKIWPVTQARVNAVTIRFVAGYGASWNDVPEPIKVALLQTVKHWYDNRDAIAAGTAAPEIPLSYRWILEHYQALEIA